MKWRPTKSHAKMLDTASAFFFFNEILSPSCTQPGQHYGRCVSDRQVHVQASGSNVHLAGPGGGVKAAVNFACQRRSLTIIFTEDEYCLIDVKVCVMMLTHDTEHVLKV